MEHLKGKYPPLSKEECAAVRGMDEATRRRDYKAFRECIGKLRVPTEFLLYTKEQFGADFIRERGYNTEFADAELGPGWLDS